MNIRFFDDAVEIEGYVNAVERNSRTIWDRFGSFIERIAKGAFQRALQRNPDVRLYVNHERDIGGQADGNLTLYEDAIGLHASARITDPDTVTDARNGDLVGWSFGYWDTDEGVERSIENGMPLRYVKDMDLFEVSILNRSKTPAFEGTLVTVRSDDGKPLLRGEEFEDSEIQAPEKEPEEIPEAVPEEIPEERSTQEVPVEINYSKFEAMIAEMKGEKSE